LPPGAQLGQDRLHNRGWQGHDDSDGNYIAQILVAGIGVHFYLGGDGALRPAACR
jgi:hypothetical protein